MVDYIERILREIFRSYAPNLRLGGSHSAVAVQRYRIHGERNLSTMPWRPHRNPAAVGWRLKRRIAPGVRQAASAQPLGRRPGLFDRPLAAAQPGQQVVRASRRLGGRRESTKLDDRRTDPRRNPRL